MWRGILGTLGSPSLSYSPALLAGATSLLQALQPPPELLSSDQVGAMGELLLSLLLGMRHNGAVDKAQVRRAVARLGLLSCGCPPGVWPASVSSELTSVAGLLCDAHKTAAESHHTEGVPGGYGGTL